MKNTKKRTQLFQVCPKCETPIRVPRRRIDILGTPYYKWGWTREVECPKCKTTHVYDDVSFSLPTKVKVENTPEIKKENDVLYAFDIGLPSIKKWEEDYKKGIISEKRYSYVAIFKECVQFLNELHHDNWPNDDEKFRWGDGFADVYTNIDNEGNVETGIEIPNEPDHMQLEKNKPSKPKDEETFEDFLKKKIVTCDECAKDSFIKTKNKTTVLCLYCGKSFCIPHMVAHLKEEHYVYADELHLDLEV